jgi:hypothetical protein
MEPAVGALERRDVRDQMIGHGRIGQPSTAQAGQFGEVAGPRSSKKRGSGI